MKKLILLTTVLSLVFFACNDKHQNNNSEQVSKSTQDSISQDSTKNKIAEYINLLSKTGKLIEAKTYPIGIFKRINYEVNSIKDLDSNIDYKFLKLTINYETSYYYYTKTAIIAQSEIKDFIKSLNRINNEYLNTNPDTDVVVAFISDGDVRIRAGYSNQKWLCHFHVNYNTDEAGVTFSKEDIGTMIKLFEDSSAKIDSLNSDSNK